MGVMQISKMLHEQGYIKQHFNASLKKFVGRFNVLDIIKQYEVPRSRMFSCILKLDYKQ